MTRVRVWRGRGQDRAKGGAFAGWGAAKAAAGRRRAWLGRRRRRGRFGIETSYRRKNQARAWTTSRAPAYRRLLEGVAHVLRQVWGRRPAEAARAAKLTPAAWVRDLPFADLVESSADHLRQQYPQAWPTQGPAGKSLENKA